MTLKDVNLTVRRQWPQVTILPDESFGALQRMEKEAPQRYPVITEVEKLVADIEAGTFVYIPGNAVHFDMQGVLANGGHRFVACALTGIPIVVDVNTCLTPQEIRLLDTGIARQIKDIPTWNKGPLHTEPKVRSLIASIGKSLLMFDAQGSVISALRPKRVVTDTNELNYIESNLPELTVAAEYVFNHPKGKIRPITSSKVEGLLYALFSRVKPDWANTFFNAILTGRNHDETIASDAIVALRERLIKSNEANARKADKLSIDEVSILIIKTWNMERKGVKVELRSRDFTKNEPKIIGLTLRIIPGLITAPHSSDLAKRVSALLKPTTTTAVSGA